MSQADRRNPSYTLQGGWTLFHILTLLVVVTFLGVVQARMLITASRLAMQTLWGRSAECLADGALEVALAHLEAGRQTGHLQIPIETGRAVAEIIPGGASGEYTISFGGIAENEERILAERHYQATAVKGADGRWHIQGVKRGT